MNLGREGIVIAVGAVVALLLQIVVAPNIALFSAQPNFLLAYVLVVAIARPLDAGSALPFALGLVCDLLGSGPVGGYAFLFVIVSFIASRAFSVLDNDTLFMPVTIFVVATFAAEMLYGALHSAGGRVHLTLQTGLRHRFPPQMGREYLRLVTRP